MQTFLELNWTTITYHKHVGSNLKRAMDFELKFKNNVWNWNLTDFKGGQTNSKNSGKINKVQISHLVYCAIFTDATSMDKVLVASQMHPKMPNKQTFQHSKLNANFCKHTQIHEMHVKFISLDRPSSVTAVS